MRDIISEASPSDRTRLLTVVFVLLGLGLIAVSVDFIVQVFGPADSVVLATNLAAGFTIIGLMAIVYYRLFVPHRIVLERDEDLW